MGAEGDLYFKMTMEIIVTSKYGDIYYYYYYY